VTTSIQLRPLADRVRFERMTTEELRGAFLVEGLFSPGEVRLLHWEAERTIVGAACPVSGPLALEAPPEIKASFFLERRELGVVNLGGPGSVTVDGVRHELDHRDGLYAGRGSRPVSFESADPARPARFWLVSHPAHAAYPVRRVTASEAETVRIGDAVHASERVLRRYIHPRGASSCQLVMGVTDIQPGSVWNTMPPHTHARRTEIYLYFDLEPSGAAFHFMGPPEATRHLVVRELEAVLSPEWSMHFAAGSSRYAFVWSMGGENQEFEDMQGLALGQLG
jgi:4-deoxy-L-threo-5-hexosulose-uronate ketol-isomerase